MLSSIIIPVHDNHEFTLACIQSIRENTKDYEIIVVDSASSQPFAAVKILNGLDGVKIFRYPENLGFPGGLNRGMEKATGDVIVFMNNDTVVTPGWLDYLLWHLDHGFDLVGPCTNAIAGPQRISYGYRYTPGVIESLRISDLNRFSESFHSMNLYRGKPHYLLVGFCIAARIGAVSKIGMFDEAFHPGNFEDNDYCLRAINLGFRLAIAQDVFIHHWSGITHKSMGLNVQALFDKNYKIFTSKWPVHKQHELMRRALE